MKWEFIVKGLKSIHYGSLKNIEAYHYKNGIEGSNTPYLWVPVNFMLMYCSDN